MDAPEEDTAGELLESGRVLREEAQELFRIAATIREQAQKMMDQAERTARILAANKAAARPSRTPSLPSHLP